MSRKPAERVHPLIKFDDYGVPYIELEDLVEERLKELNRERQKREEQRLDGFSSKRSVDKFDENGHLQKP